MNNYKIRVHNEMYGYERDQVFDVVANSALEAITKGHKIDAYARVSIIKFPTPIVGYKLRTQRFEWSLIKRYVGGSEGVVGVYPTLELATEALNECGGEFRLHSDYHGSYTLHLSSEWVTVDTYDN